MLETEMSLKNKKCIELKKGYEPLQGIQLLPFIKQIPGGWTNDSNKKISKSFSFGSFRDSIRFAYEVACIADEENHWPDICICQQRVDIELRTLAAGGLSENDFIIASKIERIR